MRLLHPLAAPLLLAALPGLVAAATLIQPGQSFVLGGEQTTPVLIEGRNTGPVAVELLRRRGQAAPVLILRAEPGQLFSSTLPPGDTALARNTSATQAARLSFRFNGQIDRLSMRYEIERPVPVAPPASR
jgi:hypothetical protein